MRRPARRSTPSWPRLRGAARTRRRRAALREDRVAGRTEEAAQALEQALTRYER
jgi:hypothetical protein